MEVSIDKILTYLYGKMPEGHKEVKLGNVTFSADEFGRYYDVLSSEWDIDSMAKDATLLMCAALCLGRKEK